MDTTEKFETEYIHELSKFIVKEVGGFRQDCGEFLAEKILLGWFDYIPCERLRVDRYVHFYKKIWKEKEIRKIVEKIIRDNYVRNGYNLFTGVPILLLEFDEKQQNESFGSISSHVDFEPIAGERGVRIWCIFKIEPVLSAIRVHLAHWEEEMGEC